MNTKTFAADPDYGMTEIARERIRLKEDRESKERAEKALEIINREFQRELDHRQTQLELIEQRINQAQKTLHLLRYVLISSYYNNQDILVNQMEESCTSTDEQQTSHKTRIHPAVRKLLGNDGTFNFYTSPRKKLRHSNKQEETVILEEPQSTKTVDLANDLNTTISLPNTSPKSKSTIINSTLPVTVSEECITGRNRKKSKYRIVVGNISKWMPSESEEDNSTHKWMVYVRGPKENPDISHFVQKVVFYLHPSYKPNDVVELRDGPFHLARRGWGEFPLRVKIFFRCSLNKPIDIIHNLKLDQTFTGRQTLGNETVVDLFLYNNNNESAVLSNINDGSVIESSVKEEAHPNFEIEDNEIMVKIEHQDLSMNNILPNFEHDYCFASIKQEMEPEIDDETDQNLGPNYTTETLPKYNVLMEHSYCITNNTEGNYHQKHADTYELQPTDCSFTITDEFFTKNEVLEGRLLEEKSSPNDDKVPKEDLQKIMLSNGKIIAIKKCRKPQQSLLKKIVHKQINKKIEHNVITPNVKEFNARQLRQEIKNNCMINYDRHRVRFPSHKFKNVTEALPYLFKRLPIIHKLAMDLNYKCTYPYTASSFEEYSKWNMGKRLSSEWYQAKTILKLIKAAKLFDCDNWTTKSIIMYARSHGYTPLANYKIFKNKKGTLNRILNGTSNNEDDDCAITTNSISEQITSKFNYLQDVMIDVVNCNPEFKEQNQVRKPTLIDPNSQYACSYIKQTVLDGGIVLKPEDIIPGVLYNASERTLLQATLCFAEELIRRARANLVGPDFQEETSIIDVDAIHKALQERSEFKLLLKSSERDKGY